jgi:hypothetical protein
MTRLSDPGFDVRIADWLEADPDLAPPDLMRTVESALPSIPQRRVMHLPWRSTRMSTFAKLAVAAVAVVAVGAVGIYALQPRSVPGVGAAPTVSPSPSPSATASPSPTPMPSSPPLSETFTSPTNGVSIAYPVGWSTRPATEPWTTNWPLFPQQTGDVIYDPTLRDHLFIGLSSQPLAGKDGGQWASDTLAEGDCVPSSPVTIDGAAGLIAVGCKAAAVTLDGRGYLIVLYTSADDARLGEVYDGAWFEQLLATVDLQPTEAASASPSP